jgi:hypothetical protein
MKKIFAGILLCLYLVAPGLASETIFDIYGPVTKIEKWPIYNGTALQGYRQTITVKGNTYPLLGSVNVQRRVNPPAMYPLAPARFSDVQPGKVVNLRLSGHMVFEIILER